MPDKHTRDDRYCEGPDQATRVIHDYADFPGWEELQERRLPKPVYKAELDAITKRRQRIKDKDNWDRTACPLAGLALSGGGIRSASFGLGALEALHHSPGSRGSTIYRRCREAATSAAR